MSIDKDIYKEMINNVEIINIGLKSAYIKEIKPPTEEIELIKVDFNYKCNSLNIDDLNDTIEFYPEFSVKLTDNEKNEYTKIDFSLKIQYRIKNIANYEKEYLDEFRQRNIPVNVWPYAREFISSSTTRLGYPALIIDPYKY